MPVVFILLAALLYGLYKLYSSLSAAAGVAAGTGAVLAVVVLMAAVVVLSLRRHRALHGRRVNGERLLRVSGDWGHLILNAEGRRGRLRLGNQNIDFIFGDIKSVRHCADSHHAAIALSLRDAPRHDLRIPMANQRQARRWYKILALAEQRTL